MILLLMMQLKRLGKSFSFNSDGGIVRLACAASMKVPVEQIIADFSAETGIRVEVQYGGSGTLLSQLP
ncbi:MAG: substrate-binding domain-containing protein, partial [Planctomycetes bacterium]|nr:substrate-binding domain-containing protein [Planctomycetota bacterium]